MFLLMIGIFIITFMMQSLKSYEVNYINNDFDNLILQTFCGGIHQYFKHNIYINNLHWFQQLQKSVKTGKNPCL